MTQNALVKHPSSQLKTTVMDFYCKKFTWIVATVSFFSTVLHSKVDILIHLFHHFGNDFVAFVQLEYEKNGELFIWKS